MWSVVSTGGIPAGDRFDWYSEIVSSEVMPARLSCERPAAFQGEAAVLDLGETRASRFSLSPLRSRSAEAPVGGDGAHGAAGSSWT